MVNFALPDLLVVFVVILFSLGLHEAMHAFMAYKLGDDTAKHLGRLTLNPLKHVDVLTTVLLPVVMIALGLPPFFVARPVPFNPESVRHEEYGIALVGLAGPLTNLVLAGLAALAVRLGGVAVGTQLFHIASIFILVNLSFFVFNMIPFPPLDGSRLLYAFAPEPLQRLMLQIESLGFSAILIFMLIFFPLVSPIVSNIRELLYRLLLG